MKSLLTAALLCAATIPSTDALTLKAEPKTSATYVKIEKNGRTVFESLQQFEDTARAAVIRQLEDARGPGFGFKPRAPVTPPPRLRTFIDPDSEMSRVTVNFYEGSSGTSTVTVRFAKDASITKIQNRATLPK